jgi:adenosylhomocysteine nucleosidase
MVAVGMSLNESPLTAVVTAMEEEMVALRARLTDARRVPARAAHITVGRLGRVPVALAVTGDGERNARLGLAALLAALPVRRLIVAGVAGGLNAALMPGALVIGERVVSEADGGGLVADGALVTAAVAGIAGGGARGVVVSATRIADTAAEKKRLLALAHAPSVSEGAAVVDLESAAFAAAANRAGIPWLVLRAVSDAAGEGVPALLNQSRDEGGAVRRGRVVRALLGNPKALLPLLALRERVRVCAAALGDAVAATIDALRAADAAAPALAPRPAPDFSTSATATEA